jgi:phosphoribosylformylglycinamidine synthase
MEKVIALPIAHAEGKFIPKDQATLEALKKNDCIVFRYVDEQGRPGGFPVNPNGSIDDVAGICDRTGRIMGLMPHPERHISFLQNPGHTRKNLPEEGDGMAIFRNAVAYVRENL